MRNKWKLLADYIQEGSVYIKFPPLVHFHYFLNLHHLQVCLIGKNIWYKRILIIYTTEIVQKNTCIHCFIHLTFCGFSVIIQSCRSQHHQHKLRFCTAWKNTYSQRKISFSNNEYYKTKVLLLSMCFFFPLLTSYWSVSTSVQLFQVMSSALTFRTIWWKNSLLSPRTKCRRLEGIPPQ